MQRPDVCLKLFYTIKEKAVSRVVTLLVLILPLDKTQNYPPIPLISKKNDSFYPLFRPLARKTRRGERGRRSARSPWKMRLCILEPLEHAHPGPCATGAQGAQPNGPAGHGPPEKGAMRRSCRKEHQLAEEAPSPWRSRELGGPLAGEARQLGCVRDRGAGRSRAVGAVRIGGRCRASDWPSPALDLDRPTPPHPCAQRGRSRLWGCWPTQFNPGLIPALYRGIGDAATSSLCDVRGGLPHQSTAGQRAGDERDLDEPTSGP
jgi:hypothetical protein